MADKKKESAGYIAMRDLALTITQWQIFNRRRRRICTYHQRVFRKCIVIEMEIHLNDNERSLVFQVFKNIPDTFIITGDIDAMWLRDSTAQVWPYLSFVNKDEKLKQLIKGLVFRQTKCILIDPYANAYNENQTGGH